MLMKNIKSVFFVAVLFASSILFQDRANAFYPNQPKGGLGIVNLNFILQDGQDHWGINSEWTLLYGLTDRFELQSTTSFVYGYNEGNHGGLGYERVKAKYQLYKNKSNTFFLAGAFSLMSPEWITSSAKAGFIGGAGKEWKPAMHLVIDWLPNKRFQLFSQIFYTDMRAYSTITLEMNPVISLHKMFDIRFYYKGIYNLQDFKGFGSLSLYEVYFTFNFKNAMSLGAGVYYWQLHSDKKFDNKRWAIITFFYKGFNVGSPF